MCVLIIKLMQQKDERWILGAILQTKELKKKKNS